MNRMPLVPISSSELGPTLELLDPITILITNLPKQLSEKEVQTYELLPSYWHNHGYAARLKMLNSLKRHASEIGIKLPDLGNLSFRMFKSSQVRGAGSGVSKNLEYNENAQKSCKIRNQNNRIYLNKERDHREIFGKYQIMHIGRWYLSAHQKRAVNYFMRKGKRMILGDGWNMGKTVTSLACMKLSRNRKVLIMTNRVFVSHWVWHVHQLLNSFSKSKMSAKIGAEETLKKQMNGNKDCDTITIQILDYPEHSKNTRSAYTYTKEEGTKLQQKTIKEEHSVAGNLYYTICSYEYMSNILQGDVQLDRVLGEVGLNMKSYNGLILDDVPVDLVKGGVDEGSYLTKICQIENVIICKDMTFEDSLYYLPLLNTKLRWREIRDRYLGVGGNMLNFNEYASSLSRNYFYRTDENCCCAPGSFIKSILLYNERGDGKEGDLMKYYDGKMDACCLYLQKMIMENRESRLLDRNKIFVLIQDYEIRGKMMRACRQRYGMMVRDLCEDGDDGEKTDLYVGRIEQILKMLKNDKKKGMQRNGVRVIFMEVRKNTDLRYKFYQNKINEIYGYGRLQYIELCCEDPKTGELKKVLVEGRKPCVTTYSFINQIISQGEYVSSDEQKQKPMPVNPERYIDTGSENEGEEIIERDEHDVSNIMIDENSEIEVLKKNGMSYEIDVEEIGDEQVVEKRGCDNMEIFIDSDCQMIDEKCCEVVEDAKRGVDQVVVEEVKGVNNDEILGLVEVDNVNKTVEPQQQIQKRTGRKKMGKKLLPEQSLSKQVNSQNVFKRETRQSVRKNQKVDQKIVHDVIKSKPSKGSRRKNERKQTLNSKNLQKTLTQQKCHGVLMESTQKVVTENLNIFQPEQREVEKQVLEISSDDEEKTLVSMRPKKAKSKQVLSIKLVPNRSYLNNWS